MSDSSTPPVADYQVPDGQSRIILEIKKSKFITTLSHATTPDEVKAFVQAMRDEFPDARHHCWAHQLGRPFDTMKAGFSDDGEPKGTAGKPMLNVLLHAECGEVSVVVSRYFGGIKLGAGGLVRAYSQATQLALSEAAYAKVEIFHQLNLLISYDDLGLAEAWVNKNKLTVLEREYGAQIHLNVSVKDLAIFNELSEVSSGRIHIIRPD